MEARKLIVSMLLVGAAAIPLAANAATSPLDNGAVAGDGPLTPEIIVGLLGYEPETVGVISYEPEPVERLIPWADFKAALAVSSIGGGEQPNLIGTCIPICQADTGNGVVGAGPFCDNSSVWIAYGKTLPPGSGYLTSTDGGAAGITTCFGAYGQTRNWQITMTVVPIVVAPGPFDGCYATNWNVGPDGYCPNSFTPRDTYNAVQIDGRGVKTTLNFGTVWFDYFLGNGANLSRF